MTPLDTIAHTIHLTVEKRPAGLLPTYGARCECHWIKRGLDRENRDEEVDKHQRYTGAEVVR